jgi:hypothetical protein
MQMGDLCLSGTSTRPTLGVFGERLTSSWPHSKLTNSYKRSSAAPTSSLGQNRTPRDVPPVDFQARGRIALIAAGRALPDNRAICRGLTPYMNESNECCRAIKAYGVRWRLMQL